MLFACQTWYRADIYRYTIPVKIQSVSWEITGIIYTDQEVEYKNNTSVPKTGDDANCWSEFVATAMPCDYKVLQPKYLDPITISGNDYYPRWDRAHFDGGWIKNTHFSEKYTIVFVDNNGKTHIYYPDNLGEYLNFQHGYGFLIYLNGFEQIVDYTFQH